ncbi:UNVERIFIED_CONTAM: hypothetical protein FKN15_015604 [Acipenser sinensis]
MRAGWLRDPSTSLWLRMEGRHLLGDSHLDILLDFIRLKPEVHLKGISQGFQGLMEAMERMSQVVDLVYEERDMEQCHSAQAGVPKCSFCLCYGHVEKSYLEADWDPDTDLEWEKPEHPTPKRGESERPSPKRGELASPQPRVSRTQERETQASTAEGDYLLLPPPPPEEYYPLLPPACQRTITRCCRLHNQRATGDADLNSLCMSC